MVDIIHGGKLDEAVANFGGDRSKWLDLSTGINPNPYPIGEIPAHCWTDLPDDQLTREAVSAVLHNAGADEQARVCLAPGAQMIIQTLPFLFKPQSVAVVGFTSSPDRKDLAELARANALPLVEDLGSGVLVDLAPYGLPDEPRVKDVLDGGVDVVTFSGDKLLGGPQAGIIAGQKDLIDQIKAHPMARAVRIDKLSLAALIATLELYREPNNPIERVPVLRALAEPIDLVYARAKQLADGLEAQSGIETAILSSKARAGGGSLPQQDLPSFAIALEADELSPDDIAERFRNGLTPVIGRIKKDQFLLDARTITDAEAAEVIEAAGTAFSE